MSIFNFFRRKPVSQNRHPLQQQGWPKGMFAWGFAGGYGNAYSQLLNSLANPQAQIQQAMMLQQMAHPGLRAYDFDPEVPTTLGWRAWSWDIEAKRLYSPIQRTVWDGPELRCEAWDEGDVVRGAAGIHALRVPRSWETLSGFAGYGGNPASLVLRPDGGLGAEVPVTGIVERFGKYVLGEDGWRAEWVIIRKLRAPTDEIGLALEEAFPDVEVIYGNR